MEKLCLSWELTRAPSVSVEEYCCTADGDGEEQCVEAAYHDCSPSRLEDLRASLEQQMGSDKFAEAYNKIKVVSYGCECRRC